MPGVRGRRHARLPPRMSGWNPSLSVGSRMEHDYELIEPGEKQRQDHA